MLQKISGHTANLNSLVTGYVQNASIRLRILLQTKTNQIKFIKHGMA